MDERAAQLFQGLEGRGPVAREVMAEFERAKALNKIEIFPGSGVAISRVGGFECGIAKIFLPDNYTRENAVFEAPRLIIDVLRAVRSPLAERAGIEDALRRELQTAASSA